MHTFLFVVTFPVTPEELRWILEGIGGLLLLILFICVLRKKTVKAEKEAAPKGLAEVPDRYINPKFRKDPQSQEQSNLSAGGAKFEGFSVQTFLTGSPLVDLWEVVDPKAVPPMKAILNIIKTKDDSVIVKKISRAVNLLSGFSHPNIVSFLGEGKSPCSGEWKQYARYSDHIYYVLTDYVKGGTLNERMAAQENGRLAISEAVYITIDILYAFEFLAYLHLVHRNLKPGNIMIDQRGVAKITGFYLLKEVQDSVSETADTESLTRAGSSLGTPEYMSIEQCKDAASVDCRSDIYSAGVILYQMLTGVSPFRGKNLNETFRNIKTLKPEPVKNLRSDVPDGLATVVMKSIEREPEKRYQHPTPFRRDLEALL